MVTYRLAHPSDYENINAFYNRIHQTNRTMEQFVWEFHDAPDGQSIYVIAEDEGKVVGTNCVIPINLLTSENQIIRSGKSEDTLVDPEYRGQNIFYNIYAFLFEQCKAAEIQVIWGFTSAKKPFSKMGFEIPFDHYQSLAVKHVGKSYSYLSQLNPANTFRDKLKIYGLCVLAKWRKSPNKQLLAPYTCVEMPITEGVDQLLKANLGQHPGTFLIHQHAQFQEWRLYKNPNYFKVHTFGYYDKDQQLIALLVYNSHPNGIAFNGQTTFHPDLSQETKVAMLQDATARLFKQGIHLVRNWTFKTNALNKELTELHARAGYYNLDRGIGFVWKRLDDRPLDPNQFVLSRIATQGVI